MMSGRCYPTSDRYKHFKADKDEGLEGEHQYVEVRYFRDQPNDDQTIDEICTTQVHLECMNDDAYWMSICGLHVWFHVEMVKVDGKRNRQPVIRVTCEPSFCTSCVVKPGEGTLERFSTGAGPETDGGGCG